MPGNPEKEKRALNTGEREENRYWSGMIKGIKPYIPGEQPKDQKYIKLNTNENPYPPSPRVLEAIKRAADGSLRLYPDPECSSLRETIARHFGLKKEQVFVGNGSDELLAFAFAAFFTGKAPILFPEITYSFFPVYCKFFGIDYEPVPLGKDFSVAVEKFCRPNGGVALPNPNAPTGICLKASQVEEIAARNPESVVLIDEAYIDFGGESVVSLVDSYPNLLVVQTFSKSRSLAGLRLGMAMGREGLIEGLRRVKDSFNSYTVDRIALAAGEEAIKDREYFEETRRKIIETRCRVRNELISMGFEVTDSMANFLFMSHPAVPADFLYRELKSKGVLVRYFDRPKIENHLRVTIGTDEEMDCFLRALREVMACCPQGGS